MPPALPSDVTIDTAEAEAHAEEAGLVYLTDDVPGVRRQRRGRGWSFVAPDGKPIRDAGRLAWFKRLAIPPAWTDVWISPTKRGHLQATGRDARGRKQYRYHPRWREVRDEAKFERLVAFARALPGIRRRVDADLRRPGLPREKVLATVVSLLERTRIRVGNDEYARENRSYGLTTLRGRHARVKGSKVEFRFQGKGGKRHEVELADRRLARIVARCQELAGQELFGYLDDDGEHRDVKSDDVNAYLREITGEPFTAKDFRTWSGTVLAAWALSEFEAFDSDAQAKSNVVRAIERVAERLGNTPAVSRKSYVHPAVIDAYLDGDVVRSARREVEQELEEELEDLPPEEAAVLGLLRGRLAAEEAARGRTETALGIERRTAPRRKRGRRRAA